MKQPGKTLILGDSYSTFEGCIPENYETWYSGHDTPETDVRKKEETWWSLLGTKCTMELIRNESWSGTTICNTSYFYSYCPKISFIGRLDKLINTGFFKDNIPDTVFVFGGTNDYWAESPLGEMIYDNWNDDNLRCFYPALSYLSNRLKTSLPNARIIYILNDEFSHEFSLKFKEVINHYNIEHISLHHIKKCYGHPNIEGMREISNQILNYLENNNKNV